MVFAAPRRRALNQTYQWRRPSPPTAHGASQHLWASHSHASPRAAVHLETPPPPHAAPPRGCTDSFCTNSPRLPPGTSSPGRSRRLTVGGEGRPEWATSATGQTAALG